MASQALRPLREPLAYAALEIEDLARLAEGLQMAIADMASRDRHLTEQDLIEAQAADQFSQRLAGLASYLNALAQAAPAEAEVDLEAAIAGLTLAAQALRLSGSPVESEHPHAGAGEFTLFGD